MLTKHKSCYSSTFLIRPVLWKTVMKDGTAIIKTTQLTNINERTYVKITLPS